MNKQTESHLEAEFGAELERLLSSVGWLHGWRVERGPADGAFDFEATVEPSRGRSARLQVECKTELRPSLFSAVADKRERRGNRSEADTPVLALPYVSPRMAGICAHRGWSWFDLTGNHRIDIPGLLRLEHVGNPPPPSKGRPTANFSSPEAGQVLRALLAPKNSGTLWTQRSLQSHFASLSPRIRPPSLGLVNKIVRHLREEAFLEESSGGFRATEQEKLLKLWSDAYRFDRYSRKGCFTLLQGSKLKAALSELEREADGLVAYAAFSAADIQAAHTRQAKTWLFASTRTEALVLNSLEAKPVDSGDNLLLIVTKDESIFYQLDKGPEGGIDTRLACTNPVQTYLDLRHAGGRGAEAAEAILDQRLRPVWVKGAS